MYAEFRKFPRLYTYGKAGTSPYYSAPHPSNGASSACVITNAKNNKTLATATPDQQPVTAASRQKSVLRRMFRETNKLRGQNSKTTNAA